MRLRLAKLWLVRAFCFGLFAGVLPGAQAPGAAAPSPLQVQLVEPLDVTHAHVGGVFFARVVLPWASERCSLQPGGMVRGRVVSLTRRNRSLHDSVLALAIDQADCKGDREQSPRFVIVAAVGSKAVDDGLSEGPPLSNDLPLAMAGGAGGVGLRRASSAVANTATMVMPLKNMPAQIRSGQVIDLPRVRLEVGSGEKSASVFTATGRDLRFEPGSTLVLLPQFEVETGVESANSRGLHMGGTGAGIHVGAQDPAQPTVAAGGLVAGELKTGAPPEAPDLTALCSEGCTEEGTAAKDATEEQSVAALDVSLVRYGFPRPSAREMTAFSPGTAVYFLDDTHLLCAFDPHLLRQRTEIAEEPERTVRVVVINSQLRRVERVFDWHVRGGGQYLWRLSPTTFLVHVGNVLQEVDAHLKSIRRLPLDGRLAWVAVSPEGDHVATGVVKERYSESFHRQMAETLTQEPEEDIEVRVYDREFRPVLRTLRSSKMPVPVLSEDGETRVRRERAGRWVITKVDWQQGEHPLATARTACRPDMVPLQDDLLFMLGCTATGDRWYRVLHKDGRPILKTESGSNEVEQAAQSSPAGLVAIRTVTTAKAFLLGQPFGPEDLLEEHVAVYSARNGVRVASVASADFALAENNFALSPDGRELVVLGRSDVHFYAIARSAH